MKIQKSLTQFKREFYEHKTGFLWVPLAITLFCLLFACYGLINYDSLHSSIQVDVEVKQEHGGDADDNDKELDGVGPALEDFVENDSNAPGFLAGFVSFAINIQNIILIAAFIIVLLTYAHSTLFEDRKSREILFWRSMPVSEVQSVLTKLAMVILIAPVIILLMNFVSGLIVFLVAGISLGSLAQMWSAVSSLMLPFELLFATLLRMLVLLPVIGWIFFASAFAKKSPFIISALVPMGLLLLDWLLYKSMGVSLHIKQLFATYADTVRNVRLPYQYGAEHLSHPYIIPHSIIAIVVGCLLIAAAIWLRNHRYEL